MPKRDRSLDKPMLRRSKRIRPTQIEPVTFWEVVKRNPYRCELPESMTGVSSVTSRLREMVGNSESMETPVDTDNSTRLNAIILLKALRRIEYARIQSVYKLKNGSCSVCLDDLDLETDIIFRHTRTTNDITSTIGHHTHCIDEWLQKSYDFRDPMTGLSYTQDELTTIDKLCIYYGINTGRNSLVTTFLADDFHAIRERQREVSDRIDLLEQMIEACAEAVIGAYSLCHIERRLTGYFREYCTLDLPGARRILDDIKIKTRPPFGHIHFHNFLQEMDWKLEVWSWGPPAGGWESAGRGDIPPPPPNTSPQIPPAPEHDEDDEKKVIDSSSSSSSDNDSVIFISHSTQQQQQQQQQQQIQPEDGSGEPIVEPVVPPNISLPRFTQVVVEVDAAPGTSQDIRIQLEHFLSFLNSSDIMFL